MFLEMQNLCSSQAPDYHSQTRTEHYRYDALGRRVWVKTLTPQDSTIHGTCRFRCDNTTRRTVWDGDQLLAEIRYPNAQGEQDSGLDSANVAAATEKLIRPTTQAGHPYGGPNTSDWAQHGRVLHVHAGGIDQPLGLIRMDYSFDFPEATLIVPHANWRGLYESGTVVGRPQCRIDIYLPYGEVVFMDSTGRRKVHPAVVMGPDGMELDTTQTRCIEIDFPGKAMGMRHLLRQNSVAGPISWMGSLVQDNQDAGGLMYRRNRFYDPKSGRFTQEDPIGLAGGVNLYGFAEGDPVSYDDPYGLRVECKNRAACETFNRIWRQARLASRSTNRTTAAHGMLLLDVMRKLIQDDQTLIISVEDVGSWNRLRNRGNGTSPCRRVPVICEGHGDYGIVVDPQADHGKGISAEVRLAHELGHAYSYMIRDTDEDSMHNYDSVQTEDNLRAIKHCNARGYHAREGGPCQ